MVRLWWLLWPQPARSPPQRWRQTAEHSEAPLGVGPPQADTTWCGCGGCTIIRPPTRWWFGGGQPLMDQKKPKSTTNLNIAFTLDPYHGGDSGWKSRRCCCCGGYGGVGGGGVVLVVTVVERQRRLVRGGGGWASARVETGRCVGEGGREMARDGGGWQRLLPWWCRLP
nr:hypothetical protein [Tanacetum cinerariifolium]